MKVKYGITATYYKDSSKKHKAIAHYIIENKTEEEARRFVINDLQFQGYTTLSLQVERIKF
ncbi:hypothetical protein M0R72_17665 [Candidatus Pacearchaeota archaeon]|jgi:hypothetical protein|nr:hypothetical protein [Candidatus Pacearchaeota archaeon]